MVKAKGWRAALKEVADLAGMELKNQANRHEAEFIKEIIKVIGAKLRRTRLFVAPILIGMHSRAEYINKWLQDDSSKVSLLGICGLGGIGKTTIAKFVYNANYETFDVSCFLADIREMSRKHDGLVGLQRQLLSRILNKEDGNIYNTHEGIIKIEKVVSSKRVLLVLDDVDQRDQLDVLCTMRGSFRRGSKIIITSRNERLLKTCDWIFRVEELGHDESAKLFNFYAFGDDPPIEGYAEHTESVVQICGGLPLALQVLGASLPGRTVPQWASEVKKLEAIPPRKILDKLKISYVCLEEYHDKRLFLDIACFFVGEDKDYAVKVLDSSTDTHADVRIQNIIDHSLLTIDSHNMLIMHKLIRDMGRNIVDQESNDEPGKRSRLWHQEDAYDVLRYKKGTRIIEGLALDMSMLMKDDNIARKSKYDESLDKASPLTWIRSFFHHSGFLSFPLGQQTSTTLRNQSLNLRTGAFKKMEKLRLLKLNYTQLDGRYDNFPKNLIWLSWHGFPLKYMPIELSLEKLVALDLRYSKLEEVWARPKLLESLKTLNLSYSERLLKTPNFVEFPNLEKLILEGCVSLIEICESIEVLEELDLLDLTDCKNLRKLPRNMYKLGSLETLKISGCTTLFAGELDISASTAKGQGKWWLTSLLMLWVPQPRRGCSSLRKITFQSSPHPGFEIRAPDYHKTFEIKGLFKREPIEKVDGRIIKNLGIDIELIKNLEVHHMGSLVKDSIQGIDEFGIFSTFIPGGEIPNVFSERKKGSEMSLIVPKRSKIQCLNICSVYTSTDFSKWYYPIGIKINNKRTDFTWIYCPSSYGIPDGISGYEDMTWLCQLNFGNNELDGGEEIVVSFSMGDLFEVKECGINIVYEEEDRGGFSDRINEASIFGQKVGAGDLSWFKLKTGLLLLCRRRYGDM